MPSTASRSTTSSRSCSAPRRASGARVRSWCTRATARGRGRPSASPRCARRASSASCSTRTPCAQPSRSCAASSSARRPSRATSSALRARSPAAWRARRRRSARRSRAAVPPTSVGVDGGRVTGVAGLAADAVVIAAGAWSATLARSAGLELPVEPRKGQLVQLERRPDFLRHKVIDGSYMAAVESEDAALAVSTVVETTIDGHVLVGSSRERRGFDLSVDGAVSDGRWRERGKDRAGDPRAGDRRAPGPAYDPGSPAACPRSAPRPPPRGSGSRPGTRAPGSRTGPSREGSSPRRSAPRRRRSTWRRSAPTASVLRQGLDRPRQAPRLTQTVLFSR